MTPRPRRSRFAPSLDVRRLLRGRHRDERGDIPGWVMITVLTIGLAIAIFTLFGDAVTDYLTQALNQLQ